MTSGAGRNGDFLIKLSRFVDEGGILFLHTYRAAASADITGEGQQFFYRNHDHIFITGSFGGLFQVQFEAHRDTKYIDTGSFAPGNQRLEHFFSRFADGSSCMIAV